MKKKRKAGKGGGALDAGELAAALQEAHRQVRGLEARLDEYKWLEDSLRRRTRELNERVKELECLYAVGRSLPRAQSLADLLLGVCESLPRGFQFPSATWAAVEIYGQRFHSPGFRPGRCRAQRGVLVRGETVGSVAVCVEPPRGSGGPAVLPEEERLLEMVAALVGRLVEEKVSR